MQTSAGLQLLTTAEAAAYLRLKERKLYELVAERQVPCTKVTGKWLFSRGDLDRWLLAGMARPHGGIPAEPPPIVGGSHDPLLQWALSECRAGLAMMPEGSEAGYWRFLKGDVIAAAIHFHDTDEPEEDANLRVVRREDSLYDSVLVGFAVREQGLIVEPGNPHGLSSIRDARDRKLQLVVRPEGAGAQQLLSAILRREGLTFADFGEVRVAQTGPDIAQAIRAGRADVGVATRAVATSAGVGFVPISLEHFDLIMRQRDYFRPPLQALLSTITSPAFQKRARDLGGLDVSGAGSVRWTP
jgi:excisionase family DNA binding protein